MATYEATGTGTSGAYSYTLRLVVNEDSYSIPNNTSSVSWALYLISTGYNFSTWSFPITCNVDGEVYNASEYRTLAKNSTLLIASGTKTIGHNNDGTKSISCSATVRATGASYLPGNIDVSGTLVLTTIPRTSSVSCASFNIGDATTITISRASSSFTHTLEWYFGNISGTIATKTSSTSVGYTIPAASLYAQIPSSTYGTGTIKCYTYSGNTHIGTSTCAFTAYAKQSDCTPTVSFSVIDTNSTTIALTGSNQKLVKGFSSALATITATAKNSASISTYYVSNAGNTQRTSSYSYSTVGSNTFWGQAIDSRGYSKDALITKTGSNWIDYIPLAFTIAKVERPESTADTATMTLKGNYFNSSFGSTNNSLTMRYRYKESGGSYNSWVAITPTLSGNTFSYTETLLSLNHDTEYYFQFNIVDSLMNVTQGIILTKGVPILRVGKDYIKVNGEKIVFPNIINEEVAVQNNYSSGSWQYVHPYTPTVNLEAGTYRFIISCAFSGYESGMTTMRPLIDNTEILNAVRSTVPIANGVLSSTQVQFVKTITTSGTHYINAQLWSTGSGGISTFAYTIERIS